MEIVRPFLFIKFLKWPDPTNVYPYVLRNIAYIFDSYMDNKPKTYQFADVAYDVVF